MNDERRRVIRLTRSAKGKIRPGRAPLFTVYLDGEVLLETTTPLSAGARALLDQGYDPAELVTVRVEDRDHDSFKPITIGEAAKWTVRENVGVGPKLGRWMPYPSTPGTPPERKSPSPLPEVPQKRIAPGDERPPGPDTPPLDEGTGAGDRKAA